MSEVDLRTAVHDPPPSGGDALLAAEPAGAQPRLLSLALRALADATDQLALFAKAGDLLIRVDADGRLRRVSEAARVLFDDDLDALAGTPVMELLHPDDAATFDLREAMAGPHLYRVRTPAGGDRWLEARCFPAGDGHGGTDGVDILARDVTDRQLAQEAVRQAEERFRLAFDMAPTGNAIVLPDGRVVRVNSQLTAMLGHPEGELLGTVWSDLVRPEEQDHLSAFLGRIAADDGPASCELRMGHATGRPVHAAVTASVVHEADGHPAYVILQVEDITARKLAQAALTHQATHDPLTALPNRTLLLDRLGHALRRAQRTHTHVALLFCDVDRFKRINDSLGHEAGDMLLVELARRLRERIRGADTAGRLSGDEFLVICEELARPEDALVLAERIRSITDEPITVGDQAIAVSLSIGVAYAAPGDEPAQLLRRADTAMYEAKERGRGRFEVFDEALRDRARERLLLEGELRQAVGAQQLRLHHQPVVDLHDGRVVGREALVRWQHPHRGLLSPAAFLDVAEESDLIVDLGGWVLAEACRQGQQIAMAGGGAHMAINVSARQLGRPDFRATVDAALAASGFGPEQLILELTETSLLHAAASTLADVEALTQQGVRLAVDDFGTGYSSLTYLQKLPVRVVKIDRSFVANITDDPQRRAITRAVISLGHALDLDIIAEGVETAEQAAMLADMGCQLAQGYLFGRPAPLDAHPA